MARKKKQINYYEGIPVPDSKEDYLEFMLKEKTRSEAWRETANGYRQWVDNYGYRKGIGLTRFLFGLAGFGAGLVLGLTGIVFISVPEHWGPLLAGMILGPIMFSIACAGLSINLKDPTADN